MKPPCEITNKILSLVASISEKIGEVNAAHLQKSSPELRKKNRTTNEQQNTSLNENPYRFLFEL